MLLLTSTSDILRLITGSAASTIEVHASFVDLNGTTVTPGREARVRRYHRSGTSGPLKR